MACVRGRVSEESSIRTKGAVEAAEDKPGYIAVVRVSHRIARAAARGAVPVRPRAVVQALLILTREAVIACFAHAARDRELDEAPAVLRAAVGAVANRAIVPDERRRALAGAPSIADAAALPRVVGVARHFSLLEGTIAQVALRVVMAVPSRARERVRERERERKRRGAAVSA